MGDEGIGKGLAPDKVDWILTPQGIKCFRGNTHRCTVLPFRETTDEVLFHDAVLKKATEEINAIVNKIITDNTDDKRSLALIEYQNRHMLVWTTHDDMVTPQDDDAKIRSTLRIKE